MIHGNEMKNITLGVNLDMDYLVVSVGGFEETSDDPVGLEHHDLDGSESSSTERGRTKPIRA